MTFALRTPYCALFLEFFGSDERMELTLGSPLLSLFARTVAWKACGQSVWGTLIYRGPSSAASDFRKIRMDLRRILD